MSSNRNGAGAPVPLQMLLSWDQVYGQMPRKDNQVWDSFCQKFRPRVEQQLVKENDGLAPTEEQIETALIKALVQVDHPSHTYMHVYRCASCPEIHRAESPCFLIAAQTFDDSENPGERMTMHNVTLAFPVATESNDTPGVLFSVHRNIPELKVYLGGIFGNMVLVDPTMTEYVNVSQDALVH